MPVGPTRERAGAAVGLAVAATLFVAGLLWAKWLPYTGKISAAAQTHRWPGHDILSVGGVRAGDSPSWRAATTFFHAYWSSIWPALLVALLISASIQALVPGSWLPRALNRRHAVSSGLAGGAAAMPSMMCTCCAAPVAVTLRRNGVAAPAAIAYWLGNPLLNPAVLAFLVLVAPGRWAVVRLVVGGLAVLGAAVCVALVTRVGAPAPEAPAAVTGAGAEASGTRTRRFTRAVLRLCLVLLPEYLALVLLIGGLRGWLLVATQSPHHLPGPLVVALVAVAGTLIVIPTAGEIPVLGGLALLGAPSGVLGALLITLPAVSVPGAAMVARSFGWRAVAVTTGVVIAAGLLGAVALTVWR